MDICFYCNEKIGTPDDRTGLIHDNGKYGCLDSKGKWTGTVAAPGNNQEETEFPSCDDHDHAEFVYGTVCLV